MDNRPYGLALDIGHSAVKYLCGALDGFQTKSPEIYPANVFPNTQEYPQNGCAGEGVEVSVNGETWIAGIDHLARNELQTLMTHKPSLAIYQALARAGLVLCRNTHIPRLITGLPVEEYSSENVRAVTEMLRGEHEVLPGHSVVVDEVEVIHQSVGALYADACESGGTPEIESWTRGGQLTVIDVGYETVDWVVVDSNQINEELSGSTKEAMSVVLHEAANQMGRGPSGVEPGEIERALRDNWPHMIIGGRQVDHESHVFQSAHPVAENAARSVYQFLRHFPETMETVLITGGGARYYEKAIRERFPHAKVRVTADPATANARGAWYYLANRVCPSEGFHTGKPQHPDNHELRFQVRIGPGFPELLRDLEAIPQGAKRADRAKYLMALGEWVLRQGSH